MPIRYEIEPRMLRFCTEGDVAYDETMHVLRDGLTRGEDAIRSGSAAPFDLLFDVRESLENRSAEELRQMADLVAERSGILSGRAAVVASDVLHFGLGRMFGAYADARQIEVRVFYSLEEAESWLARERETTRARGGEPPLTSS